MAVCQLVLPVGMMGLLVSGIFAATMSSMDSGLNRLAGIVVMNFYKPVFAPDAPEKRLVFLGKIATTLQGVAMIGIGLLFSRWNSLGLFDFVIRLAASVILPMAVPLVLGFFLRRGPDWASWTTTMVGLIVSFFLSVVIDPATLANLLGIDTMSERERIDFSYAVTVFSVIIICAVWYVITVRLSDSSLSKARVAEKREFFNNQKYPVISCGNESASTDSKQSRFLGWLCVIYGVFLLFGVFIPNDFMGRGTFVFASGFICLIGFLLLVYAKRMQRCRSD